MKTQKIITSKEKISIAECKKILCKNGKVYSENEIISIRDLLYCFAQIDIDTFHHIQQKEKEAKQIELELKKSNISTENETKKLKNVA